MTNETKHTPGKWAVKTYEWTDYLGHVHTERTIVTASDHPQLKRPVSVVSRRPALPEKDDFYCCDLIDIEPADAQLIACAPELLEALESFCGTAPSDWMEKRNRLIAKAKGGNH